MMVDIVFRVQRWRTVAALALALSLAPLGLGCGGMSTISVDYDESCEGLSSEYCLLPWPSDRWLAEDSSTQTGLRLAYEPGAMPLNKDGEPFDVEAYAFRDGYSPASTILALFEGDVDLAAMPGVAVEGSWELSLAPDSPTILLDLETGERIPHMVEVDARAHEDDEDQLVPDKQLVYLRPARRLEENRRYGVAFREVALVGGGSAESSAAFAALRDGQLTDSTALEARRPSYDQLFAALEAADVPKAELTLAWWFHTASGDNLRGSLLAMRDDAMERVPVGGGDCTVTSIEEDHSEDSLLRVNGTFRSPLYMDSPYTGSRAVRDEDGLPVFQGWTDAPFTMLVPRQQGEEGASPARLLSFGHGLMGEGRGEGGGGFLQELGQRYNMVTVATDWQGMSVPDIATVGIALSDVGTFPSTGERLMQGVINNLVMTRSFKGACRDLPELQGADGPYIDAGPPYWLGISQGGIMGGTLMALSQDTTRGALLVGAANYPLMIGRSVDFYAYEVVYRVWYPERVDREVLMSVMISMWDHAEPNVWLRHLTQEALPNTPLKQVLYQIARDDSQVPNLASDIAVRTMGLPLLTPSPVEPWGIEQSEGPEPSAYVYFDLDREPAPAGNEAPLDDNGSHGAQRRVDAAMEQMNLFWQPDGMVYPTCEGPCDPD